jgi:hypothetical protein
MTSEPDAVVRMTLDRRALDPHALARAADALDSLLRAEADAQNAYLFKFADGRISLELEWIDIAAVARQVVSAYVEHISR